MAQINTLMLIRYPEKISRTIMDAIQGYSLKVDKLIMDSEYMKQAHQYTWFEHGILKKYKPKYFIEHQFYTYLGVQDLERMLNTLSKANRHYYCIGLYPIGERTLECEWNEKARYMEGTCISRADMLQQVIERALKTKKKISAEQKTVEAVLHYGYEALTAPFAREYTLPSHNMISKTTKHYLKLI